MIDIELFEQNPDDPSVMLQFSVDLAAKGYHNLALMVTDAALDDTTVDHTTRSKLLEQTSISGFYATGHQRKLRGKAACEELALDRRNSWHTKNLARQNSTYYVSAASDIMFSTRLQQIQWLPADDYKPMNPSIVNKGNELWMIQRTVNYVIRADGSYNMRGDTAIRTRNILMQIDPSLDAYNGFIMSAEEIHPPIDMPAPLYSLVVGFEDCRLFWWRDSFWCTSTVRELNADGYCEIVLSQIVRKDDGLLHFDNYRVIHPKFGSREHQKNWMPMVVGDNLYFLYSSDPTRIIDDQGNCISLKAAHMAADSFRGGGPLLSFNGGWLGCIHESHIMPDNRRRYLHRFVWYDSVGRLSKYSEAFYFHTLGIEFAAGLAHNADTGQVIVSFGLVDVQSWLAIFDENEIKRSLKPAGEVMSILGDTDDTAWLLSQTNCSLKDQTAVDKATWIAMRCGIKSHEDAVKNWDNLIAVWHATMTSDHSLPVMDVAATQGSAFLPTLRRFGYETLISINIDQPNPGRVGGIDYQCGDCTKTGFADGYFGFISCLSVIEHGVDVAAFLAESSRILAPNGYLLISTDYWQDPVDTQQQMAFGAPVKVFTAPEIAELINMAKTQGLEITSNVDLSCDQRVVNWLGMDYTFINLLFRKTA